MDIERLRQDDEEQVKAASKHVTEPSDLPDLLRGLKGVYADVYSNTRWSETIAKTEPTYYRKDSAKASAYVARNREPVIVFLHPGKRTEDAFEEYTGMGPTQFLEQVASGAVIPTRDRARKYEDVPFYEDLFDRWDRHDELGERPPLYANALEDAMQYGDDKFWKTAAHKLLNDHPRLVGESVQPFPNDELDPVPATRYLGERIQYLDAAGHEMVVEAIEALLEEFDDSGRDEWLERAAKITFHAHELFSVPIFYTMGSTVTLSRADYAQGLRTINDVYEYRRDTSEILRGLVQLNVPLSKWLLEKQRDPSVLLPESGTLDADEFQTLQHNERARSVMEDVTEFEAEHMDSLTSAQVSSKGVTSDLKDEFEELRELRQNAIDVLREELEAPHDWAAAPINLCATVTAHLPKEPIEKSELQNLALSNEPYELLGAINEWIREGRLQDLYSNPINRNIKGQIWEAGTDHKEGFF